MPSVLTKSIGSEAFLWVQKKSVKERNCISKKETERNKERKKGRKKERKKGRERHVRTTFVRTTFVRTTLARRAHKIEQ